MTSEKRIRIFFQIKKILAPFFDSCILLLSYLTAFVFRLNFNEPIWGWRATALSFLVVLVVYLLSLSLFGCYRTPLQRISVLDIPRFIGAGAVSSVVLLILRLTMTNMESATFRFSYSIILMTTFFALVGFICVRLIFRVYYHAHMKATSLISRDEISFDQTKAARFFAGKCVLVTGAGGSIGSEICRQVATLGAQKILLVERCERALYEIDRQLRGLGYGERIHAYMIDINEEDRMRALFEAEKVQIVLHAAAYKHVPMVEVNPEEGWRNNVQATEVLSKLAAEFDVQRFVLISTDKAVNPVSVMGKTKAAAEKVILSFNKSGDSRFCAVRFGNVFGSSGSVVPLFEEKIRCRLPLTVTHPDMKRYFMTVKEAVSLVLQAASRSEGAIYTLDMGQPISILELAENMIRQAGYCPYTEIPIIFTGIRPGEKLFEELDISEKSAFRTDMAKIYITKSS